MRLIYDPTPLTIAKLPPDHPVPTWADGGRFSSTTRTPGELSIVCETHQVPAQVVHSGQWVRFEVEGPLPFSLVGVLSSLAAPLAEVGVSIFAIATHDTDHLLVRRREEPIARDALTDAGHVIVAADSPHP
jgi:hypothetical protein